MSDVNNMSINERNATVLAHQAEGEANLWFDGSTPHPSHLAISDIYTGSCGFRERDSSSMVI